MTDELLPRYENSYALIVGVNSYTDPRFVPLGEAEEDAQRLSEALMAPPHNFMVRCLLGNAATKEAILHSMYNLRETGVNDRILLYFACHGYTLADKFGNEAGYLAMYDTVPDMDFTALHIEEVVNLRRYANAKHISFVFDACFSGQALGLTRAANVAAEKFLTRRAYQVISAGTADQTVSDFNSMTDFMIEALTGPMTTETGVFTTSDLGQHLKTTLAADSGQLQIPQYGHLRGSQGGDFVFFVDEGAVLPPEVVKALHSENFYLRFGGVSALIDLIEATGDQHIQEVAVRVLNELLENETNQDIITLIEEFFALEEARIRCDQGEISADEVTELIDASRQRVAKKTQKVVEESTSGGTVRLDELLALVGSVDPPETVSLVPKTKPKPAPAGELKEWGSVKGKIDTVLDELDTHDDEKKQERSSSHDAPTQINKSRVDDLQQLLNQAKEKQKRRSDTGWDDREEWS